jgi:hypothetical protein
VMGRTVHQISKRTTCSHLPTGSLLLCSLIRYFLIFNSYVRRRNLDWKAEKFMNSHQERYEGPKNLVRDFFCSFLIKNIALSFLRGTCDVRNAKCFGLRL